MTNTEKLKSLIGADRVAVGEPLAKHTTLSIGGPADLFFQATTEGELVGAVRASRSLAVPVTILGWGSNVLISDTGIRGLVIKNEIGEIKVGRELVNRAASTGDKPRWQSDRTKGTFKYEFNDLNYDEKGFPRLSVTLGSGVALPKAINYLLDEGVTGLQWFARIPGTIGGAVFNNIHGGTRFLSEFLESVTVLTRTNEIVKKNSRDLGLSYDKSLFHENGEIILAAEFALFRGDVVRARQTAKEWARRKALQPSQSAGCTFKNISNRDMERLGLPTTSTAYIVEHVLQMTGFRIGDAAISNAHHNFIVNTGKATAKDYLTIVSEIKKRTREKLGINLEEEIIFLGDF